MNHDSDNKRREAKQRGLTLVELLVALVVVAVSMLAFYQMFITGNMLIAEQYQRRTALERAQAWMERMKYYENEMDTVPRRIFNLSFEDTIVAEDDDHEPVWANCEIHVEHSSDRDPDTGVPYYSDVSVVYSWVALSGRDYRVELRSKF